MWTDEALDRLEALAAKASPDEWRWAITPTKTVNAAVRWIAKTVRQARGQQLWGVMVGPEDAPRWVAYTGNGVASEANSEYLVAVQPRNVIGLIAELRQARHEVAALREVVALRKEIETLRGD